MKNIHAKSVQVFGFIRIISFTILGMITIFATINASALAPHAPDMALTKELDMHRESIEKQNNQKASQKVDTYKNYKEQKKAEEKAKRTDPKKTKTEKPKSSKPKKAKTPKPPKPSKSDKKKAAKHKAETFNKL